MHTTHQMSEEQKQALLQKYEPLITLIYFLNCMGLRKQIKRLYHLLYKVDEITIDFMIADLIQNGFLINRKITNSTRCSMLYLSKWPRAQFEDGKGSGDISSLCFSQAKLMSHIFKVDYIIDVIIPTMKKSNLPITLEYIAGYLDWLGCNLLIPASQVSNIDFYESYEKTFKNNGYSLSNDFYRDIECAAYEKSSFIASKSKDAIVLEGCDTKLQRDAIADSYSSDIERNKQFYNLNNFASHGFVMSGINELDTNEVSISYFDYGNNLQTKKLWQQLGYILLMFQRYTSNLDIRLKVNIYVWDEDRKKHLENEEHKQAYDFYRQEWVEENKAHHTLKSIGILPSNWDNITTEYIIDSIYEKYNITNY